MIIDMRLLSADRIAVAPAGFLQREHWGKYRQACSLVGAVYSGLEKAQLVNFNDVPLLCEKLIELGFDVNVQESLSEALVAHANELQEAERAADEAVSQLGITELYPFQREGVGWLHGRDEAILADEMGLGKTVQALVAAPKDKPILVIAPACAKSVWAREIKRWCPDRDVDVMKGNYLFYWPSGTDVMVMNYDIMPAALFPFGDPEEGTVLIADEAHALKSRRRKRWKLFRKIVDKVKEFNGKTWLLTGTPMLNYPPELWNVLDVVDLAKPTFGNMNNFVRLFRGVRRGWHGYHWGTPEEDLIPLLQKHMLRRRRRDVLPDLPDKTYQDMEVNNLSNDAIEACDQVVEALEAAGFDLESISLEDLQEFGFETMSRARRLLASAKVPALLEIVEQYEETETPLVVFSAHRIPVDVLGEREGWATITGSVSPDERGEIVRRFQRGDFKGIALTIQAGGVGLTLTHSHHAVFVDLAWTPAANKQAEDRICRIGQTRGVQITQIVAEHKLDQRVAEILGYKANIIENSVEKAAVQQTVRNSQRFLDAANHRNVGIATQSKFREPETDLEIWAANGVIKLANSDPDHARDLNGVGFNKIDGDFGHSLADQLRKTRQLSDKQWKALIKLVVKYRRQIGEPPL